MPAEFLMVLLLTNHSLFVIILSILNCALSIFIQLRPKMFDVHTGPVHVNIGLMYVLCMFRMWSVKLSLESMLAPKYLAMVVQLMVLLHIVILLV